MLKILDQTGDINGQQLYRLSRLYPLPDFVKKASSDAIYGNGEMQNHQYADPTHRMFPCHTGPATYISTLFFIDKCAEMTPDNAKYINARLDDFAFYHGIAVPIKELREKLAADKPTDSTDTLDDSEFALILEPEDSQSGARERMYPLRNALEVKRAAEWLQDYDAAIPYKYRQKIAARIVSKAEEYGAGLGDLDDFLQKEAGIGVCSSYDAATFLFERARLLKRAGKLDYAVRVGEIAKTVAGDALTVQNPNQLIKLASIVDEIDREVGLNRLIEDLQKPEDVFFNITEKKAAQLRAEHLNTTTGNIYKLKDIDSLKLADVRDMMGTAFAEAISTGGLFVSSEKIADVVPTLPRPDAELFDRLLSSMGIAPVAKEASHSRDGFDTSELKALATLHKGINW